MENMLQMLRLPYMRFNAICPTLEESSEIKNLHNRVKSYLHDDETIDRVVLVLLGVICHICQYYKQFVLVHNNIYVY